MRTSTVFKVAGIGAFPLDMLRFDRCYPATPDAVIRMKGGMDQRTVELRHDHAINKAPHVTRDRWASYGWPVVDIRTPRRP
jgi:hypothetical protein